MLSIHGLVRGRDPELGRDADTGGRISRAACGRETPGRIAEHLAKM
jgi:hypothetical protein